ncbi:hypothetical protein [Streptomyces sp. NPDC094149]|uniref:hypothetical protein n=1 Tax=Streptomyces sp. NPDC094149 TaxID=3155079 RepID=UPI0033207801
MPWGHIGAVIGAVAAVGGLVFTGVATYYGAVISRDQLQQSREDATQEARAQAQLVSVWVESDSDDTGNIHLMNRSPDPVYSVYLGVSGEVFRYGILSAAAQLHLRSLPPCTEMIFSGKGFAVRSNKKEVPVAAPEIPVDTKILISQQKFRRFGNLLAPKVIRMSFGDRNDQSWQRGPDSSLKEGVGDWEYISQNEAVYVDRPKTIRASTCSDGGL